MILIISEPTDVSTSIVIKWLKKYSADFVRINNADPDEVKLTYENCNDGKEFYIELDNTKYPLNEFDVIWYRRFEVRPKITFQNNPSFAFQENIKKFIQQEKSAIIALLSLELKEKYWLNHPSQGRLNKILQINIARQCGMEVPDTLITNNKCDLLSFYGKHKHIIIKPALETLSFPINAKEHFPIYTKKLCENDIREIPETFLCSMFQEEIKKEFEIRTFYLEGEMYSMAIFSQFKKEAMEDFRQYSLSDPVRRTPYNLPKDIEEKLILFMNRININCGSFDIIKTKDGKYVFLELNPVGQFGMTSFPCNYNLEKKIALHLIKKDHEIKREKNL